MKRGVVVLAACVTSACFTDYIVAPRPNLGARMTVFISTVDNVSVGHHVRVSLDPGTDAFGNVRPLGDSTVMVGDSIVFPQRHSLRRQIEWGWDDSWSTIARDSLVIRYPDLLAHPIANRTVRFPLAVRDGPRDFTHPAGQDLTLRVRGVPDSIGGLVESGGPFWSLTVSDPPNSKQLIVSGSEARTAFTIPAGLMSTAPGDSLIASLYYYRSLGVPDAPFMAGMLIQSSITWVARIVSAP